MAPVLIRVIAAVVLASSLAGCGASRNVAQEDSPRSSHRHASAEELKSWRCSEVNDRPVKRLTADQRQLAATCAWFSQELKRHPMTADGFAMTYCHLDVEDAPRWVVVTKAACDAVTEDLRAGRES